MVAPLGGFSPSVRETPHAGPMFLVELVCGDDRCEMTLETVDELDELEVLVCECGCCLQVVSISEVQFAELSRRPLELLRSAPGRGADASPPERRAA